MVDFLELYQGVKIDLRLGPSPKEVPAALEVHAVRELEPVLGSIEGGVDDVIDFRLVFYYTIKEVVVLFLFKVIFGWVFAG